jgi:AcrR family transcriptional regulator
MAIKKGGVRPTAKGIVKRTRLAPDVRRKQILEAALVEFGNLGFSAASISKIAERAGMSKANVYVHFKSKDDMFETLLQSLLALSDTHWAEMHTSGSQSNFVDRVIDSTYAALTPEALAIMRLLIAEAHRVPAVIEKWRVANHLAQRNRQAEIERLVASGSLKEGPLAGHFEFAMAPLVYVSVARMTMGDAAEGDIEAIKETHRKVLHLLLDP